MMSRISVVEKNEASEDVKGILTEIEGAFGMVPNLFKTYSHFPPLLKANWDKVKVLMMQGKLSRKTKEAIAVLISKDNSCSYCVAAHTAALKSIGVTEEEIEKIENNIEEAEFTEKECALITFARKANKDPNKITDEEFALLKQTGADEAEIVEALGVMELFTAFNKFLDSLNVEVDF